MAFTPFPPAYTSSAVDSAAIEAAVEDYLTANPPGVPNHADLPDLDESGHPASQVEYTDAEGVFGAENGVLSVQTVLGLLAPKTRTVGTGLSTTGTVNLDMAAVHGTIQAIAASGSITFTSSNRVAGREVTLVIAAGGSSRTLAWPAWLAVGAALPTSLASGKTLVVTVTFVDTTDAAAIAASSVQP